MPVVLVEMVLLMVDQEVVEEVLPMELV